METEPEKRRLPERRRADLAAFWSIVTEAAALHDGSVISGIRSKARNKSVGGHPESRHIVGFAADITFTPDPEWAPDSAQARCSECFEWLRDEGLRGYIRKSGTSLHIQDRAAKAPN